MQNDLISRSALVEKLNDTSVEISVDLSVEKILGEDVDMDDFCILLQATIQAYRKMVIGVIQEQPVSYDVEKVVGQIITLVETPVPSRLGAKETHCAINFHTEIKAMIV